MIIAIYRNDKGRKTYLHSDDAGTFSAFVGSQGGNLRTWKTIERADKELENKGFHKIAERKAQEA
jgi:hypothetical protein